MSPEVILDGASVTGSRSLLRRMNSLGILRLVAEEPSTLRELAGRSGLSRTAVDAVATDLVELGWIEPRDAEPSGRLGRPAATFALRAGLGCFLAIDIGANHIVAVLTDLSQRVIEQRSAGVAEGLSASARIDAALALADEVLTARGVDRSSVWTVSIGSPGVIDATGSVRHFGGEGMPGWVGLDVRERFAAEFAGSVLVEGDVALGAHAELAKGQARGRQDVVYLLCGVRTSAAVVIGGRVRRGVHGAAGIVGEMPELKWRELNEQYGSALFGETRPSREEIFARAREGEAVAVAAMKEFAADLATGAAAMTLALDPELIVIGGGSAKGADVFLEDFISELANRCPEMPAVAVSTLGSDAVALGAVSLAAAHVFAVLQGAVRTEDTFPDPGTMMQLLHRADPTAVPVG